MSVLESLFDKRVFIFEFFRSTDSRGDFTKIWTKGLTEFVAREVFISNSRKGVIRGLHYILRPETQRRIVVCLTGKIRDFVVDIRQGSPTFRHYVEMDLNGQENRGVYIDQGFAHGFLALEESRVLYLADVPYNQKYDRGIRWNDPSIGIPWGVKNPILSEKDAMLPLMNTAEINFIYDEPK